MTSYETVDELQGIPIQDNGEPLADFAAAGILFAKQHPVFPFPRVHLLRQSVVGRLLDAQAKLPLGWRLVLVEGFRTLEAQRMQHDALRKRMQALYPHFTPEQLKARLEDFSAPPDHPQVPPPHSTGGAFDCHLLNENGELADFISPFTMDDQESAAFDADGLSEEARRNRMILKTALESAGITNYPGEWWHWSYGDQGWAHRGGHPNAVFGRLDYTIAEAEALQNEPANREPPLRTWDTLEPPVEEKR